MIKYILVILLTISIQAETSIGVGKNIMIPGVDTNNAVRVYSVRYFNSDYFVDLAYRDKYQVYGTTIKQHLVAGFGYRLFEYKGFFLEIGGSVTSDVSIVNSSRANFKENFGWEYEDFKVILEHTSNAGIIGANEGQTALLFYYTF